MRKLQLMVARLLGPAVRLIDTSTLFAVAPRQFASQAMHDEQRSFTKALTFFITAVSAGLILDKIGYLALGGGALNEIYYWIITILFISAFALLLSIPLSIGKGMKTGKVIHLALFSMGASCFVASLVFVVAATTVFLLQYINYIPSFVLSPSEFDNFEEIGMRAYRECIMDKSLLMHVILQSDGAVDMLAPPIRRLPYVRIAVFALYIIPLTVALATLLKRSILFVSASAVGSIILLFSLAIYGFVQFDEYIYRTTDCSKISIEAANKGTIDSQLQIAVQSFFTPKVGKGEWVKLTDVTIEGRSVIIHLTAQAEDRERHIKDMDGIRKATNALYCVADAAPWRFFRQADIRLVHIFRLTDGTHVGTYTANRDECRR